MDGSQLVARAGQPRGTSDEKAQLEGDTGHAWPTADPQIDNWTNLPNVVQGQRLPRVTPVVKLRNIIGISVALMAGILAFDFLILWIASARVIDRLPF